MAPAALLPAPMVVVAPASREKIPHSQAVEACPVQPFYPLPTEAPLLQGVLSGLDAVAEQCLRNAPFHAWRGAVLLALDQPALAVEALERALLIDPALPGAQLDYAQALLAVGDTASARGLLQQIQARPDLPPHLVPLLRRELAATDPDAWRTRWLLSTAVAHDSNLNNAPAASELTLTFPQGPITLPLAVNYRPQRGGASLNTAQWQGVKPSGSQLWLLQAELRTRHTGQAATGYQQADAAAHWLQAPDAPSQWVARAGLTRVDLGGQRLLQGLRASLLHQWRLPMGGGVWLVGGSPCRAGAGLEAEHRRYPVTPELDGLYTGALLSLTCPGGAPAADAGSWLTHQQAGLQLRWGQDQAANPDRPGGAYSRVEVRLNWEGRRGAIRLQADYGYTHQSDGTGYSPLLSDNLSRRTTRHSLRLEAGYPLPQGVLGGAEAFISLEVNRQHSNLAAFAIRQRTLSGGLRWALR